MYASNGWINMQAMIISQRCVRVVDPLSCLPKISPSFDFHRFTDCHPEAICDVNERRDLLHCRREERSSDHRQFFSEPGSVYDISPHRHSQLSDLTTRLLFDDFFEVHITKMMTLSPNVQTVLPISLTL